jgi:hypothetical protein
LVFVPGKEEEKGLIQRTSKIVITTSEPRGMRRTTLAIIHFLGKNAGIL